MEVLKWSEQMIRNAAFSYPKDTGIQNFPYQFQREKTIEKIGQLEGWDIG